MRRNRNDRPLRAAQVDLYAFDGDALVGLYGQFDEQPLTGMVATRKLVRGDGLHLGTGELDDGAALLLDALRCPELGDHQQ